MIPNTSCHVQGLWPQLANTGISIGMGDQGTSSRTGLAGEVTSEIKGLEGEVPDTMPIDLVLLGDAVNR